MAFRIVGTFESLVFGVLVFSLLRQVRSQVSCQRWKAIFPDCLCYGALDENGEQIHRPVVDCSSLGLTAVPNPSVTLTDQDDLYEFRLTNNNLTRLDFNAFHGIEIERLFLTGNKLVQLNDDAFTNLATSLKLLHIEGDSTGLPQRVALGKLTNLEELTMINYHAEHILATSQVFYAFDQLQTLTLDNWGIKTFEAQAFLNSKSRATITNLILTNQNLPTLPVNVLNDVELKQLRKLHISYTPITDISSQAFDHLDFIEEINLSHNGISQIESNALNNAIGDTLKKLDLSNNQLGANGKDDLEQVANLNSLEQLKLRDNLLSSVPKLPNLGSGKLLTIDLRNNRISSLAKEDLASYSQRLAGLDVAENSIETVNDQTFEDTTKLKSLDVSHQNGQSPNALTVPSSLANAANSLTYLDFSGREVDETNLWQTIQSLINLEILKLNSVGLSKIDDLTFLNLNKLTEIDLSYNEIAQLTNLTLVGPLQLKKLNLRNNRIKVIPSCLFHQIQNTITLDLGFNPIDCSAQNSCDNKKFIEDIQKGKINFPDTSSVPRCSQTSQALEDIDPSTLSCDQAKQCPDPPSTQSPTPPATTATTDINYVFSIRVSDIEKNAGGLHVSWNINDISEVKRFHLLIESRGTSPTQRIEEDNLSRSLTHWNVTGLKSGVLYEICVRVIFNNDPLKIACKTHRVAFDPNSTASPRGDSDSDSASVEIIVGCVVGAVLLLIVLAAIVYILFVRRKPQKKYETTAPTQPRQFTKAELPTMNGDSRSFVKVKKNGAPGPKHEGMQVVAISDGQNRPSQKGRVGRANLMSTDGTYKSMDKSLDSKGMNDGLDYEPMAKPSQGKQGNVNQAYENDHGSLPSTPGLPSPSSPSPRGFHGAYYNDGFTKEPTHYDEITI